MENRIDHIQSKWEEGFLPGIDCILFGDGNVIVANFYYTRDSETNKRTYYWFPLCDTTIESLEKYEPDIYPSRYIPW